MGLIHYAKAISSVYIDQINDLIYYSNQCRKKIEDKKYLCASSLFKSKCEHIRC